MDDAKNPADHPFVPMIGHYPYFRVGGCIVARDAKIEAYWRENADPPCWWVPESVLGDYDDCR